MTDRKNWQLGVSTILGGPNFDDETLQRYADAGVKYLEISHPDHKLIELRFIETAVEFVKNIERFGLKVWSLHLPFWPPHNLSTLDKEITDAAVARYKEYIKVCGESGIGRVVLHPSTEPIEDDVREQCLRQSVECCKELVAYAKQHSVTVCVEDLPRTCLCNCSYEVLIYLNEVPELQLCFDTNHLLRQTNEDFLDDLIDNGMVGRIGTLHVSDYDFIDERHRLPGDGINDWQMICSKLEQLDYDGPFMYEVSGHPKDRPERSPAMVAETYKKIMSGEI